MGVFLEPSDFPGLDDAETLIDDAEALAMLSAPCLEGNLTEMKIKAVRAILRGTIMRWNDAGNGTTEQQNAGPFGMTTTPQVRRNSFWPSEITDLQKVCRSANDGKAYSIDTVPVYGSTHAAICNLNLGGTHCSCGANLTAGNGPLWELDV
jgi:hypothetical protein